MNIKLLFAGLFFLINPHIGVFDFMPDVIGYALIWRALSPVEILHPAMSRARESFLKLCYTSLGRTASFFLLFMMQTSAGSNFDGGWSITFVFSLGCLELYYAFAAFSPFFDSCDTLALRADIRLNESKRSNLLSMTYAFMIGKQAMAFLAETPFLWSSNLNESMGTHVNYKLPLVVLNIIVVTLLGIVWYCMTVSYLRPLRCERFRTWINDEVFKLLGSHPDKIVRRRLASSYKLISIAFFFIIFMSLENIDIIPDVFFALFAAIALHTLQKPLENGGSIIDVPKRSYLYCVICGVLSVAKLTLSAVMYSTYNIKDSSAGFTEDLSVIFDHYPRSKVLFGSLFAVTVLEAISLVLLALCLYRVLCRCAKVYTVRTYETEQFATRNEDMYNYLRYRLKLTFISVIVLAAVSVIQQFLIVLSPALWFVVFLISVAAFVLALVSIGALAQETENSFKYG